MEKAMALFMRVCSVVSGDDNSAKVVACECAGTLTMFLDH